MSTSVTDREIAKFETAVRLINWENGIFVGLVAVGFGGAAVQAGSAPAAFSRWFVVTVALVSGAVILANARYRLKLKGETSDLLHSFRDELTRQARLRRLAPVAVVPFVAALLLNAWVVKSIFSAALAFFIAVCAWANVYLARMWHRGAVAIETKGDLYNWRMQPTTRSARGG